MSLPTMLFGSIPLLAVRPSSGYWMEAASGDTDFGNPEAVITEVTSALLDGSAGEVSRYNNSTVSILIRINGYSPDDLSDGEMALMVEVNKPRNTLSWRPPNASVFSVFDVAYSTLKRQHDDVRETTTLQRIFVLTLACIPGVRRDTPTTVVAVPQTAVPTVTSIDACTALTNWAVVGGGSIAVSGGTAIRMTPPVGATIGTVRRSGLSTVLVGGDFVVIELEAPATTSFTFTLRDGLGVQQYPKSYAQESTGSNRSKYYLAVGTGYTLASIEINAVNLPNTGFLIHDVSKSTGVPFSGSARQRFLAAMVSGSMRTAVDLSVVLPNTTPTGEGEMLIFTSPVNQAIAPMMTPWWAGGGVSTPDATTISGARKNISANEATYSLPINRTPPGTHLIVARLRRITTSGSRAVPWQVGVGSSYAATPAIVSGSATLPLTTTWGNYVLGTVVLPTLDGDPDSTNPMLVRIGLSTAGYAPDTELDELWLFNLDTGVLTWVNVPLSGGRLARVVVKSATLDREFPGWYGAPHSANADESISYATPSPGVHIFNQGLMNIFLVTPQETSQTVTLTFYERFLSAVPKVAV